LESLKDAESSESEASSKPKKVKFYEDLGAAKTVMENTSCSLNKVLNDFRLNNYIAVPEIKSCVQNVVANVMRNPNALVLLSNLRIKKQDTAAHSINVCVYATVFGRYLSLNPEQLTQLCFAALLHDVGEIKIPQSILDSSPEMLTQEEHKLKEMHTKFGADILHVIEEIPAEVAEVAHSHHERIDGNGYPRSLKGTEINFLAKIISIVDQYEMLTNAKPPQIVYSSSDAIKSIYAMRDTYFDGNLIESFIKCLGIYPIGSLVQLNNGATGIVIGMKQDNHLLPTIMVIRDKSGEIRHPPQVINLDKYRDHDGKPLLLISKVIDSDQVDIDLYDFIIKELGSTNNHIKSHA
jgi:HD-GYP domain-containing protein (c-di-GMP phosphodiesterase class II)